MTALAGVSGQPGRRLLARAVLTRMCQFASAARVRNGFTVAAKQELAAKLIEYLKSAESRERFERIGFGWGARGPKK